MGLKLDSKIPYGNARVVSIRTNDGIPEVNFAADPHGSPESLWFCFRLKKTGEETDSAEKVRLVLKYFQTMEGGSDPLTCRPVLRQPDQNWMRMRPGKLEIAPDGQYDVSWLIDYPKTHVDIAFCYPYGRPEIDFLQRKAKSYWKSESIGLSQKARTLLRLSNDFGGKEQRPGLYLMARQRSGDTSASWVLDGFLQHFSRVRNNPWIVWCAPLLNIDGVIDGDYGHGPSANNLNGSWGNPPATHEARVFQQDFARWGERCRPELAVEFCSAGASDSRGVYTKVPEASEYPELRKGADKWANILKDALTPRFAAEKFSVIESEYSNGESFTDITSYFMRVIGIPALKIVVPYSMARDQVLTCKSFREIGNALAGTILKRSKQ